MVYFLMKVLQVLKNVAILYFNISRNIFILPLQLNKYTQLLFTHVHDLSSYSLKQDVPSCAKYPND